jgi:hypothetical protein
VKLPVQPGTHYVEWPPRKDQVGHGGAVSYDVYFWWRATGDIDELFDELAADDVSSLVPNRCVLAFRQDVLARWPRLVDVVEPGDGSPGEMSFLAVTLPFAWVADLPQIVELAVSHGLSGWDPQADESFGRQPQRSIEPPLSAAASDVFGEWMPARLRGLGVGAKSIARAWSLAGLPAQVSFGEAVGAYILALALRDGVDVDAEQARAAVLAVARDCAYGVPSADVSITIGFTNTDVTGFAGVVAQGHF